jgi:hypothetical protein
MVNGAAPAWQLTDVNPGTLACRAPPAALSPEATAS